MVHKILIQQNHQSQLVMDLKRSEAQWSYKAELNQKFNEIQEIMRTWVFALIYTILLHNIGEPQYW